LFTQPFFTNGRNGSNTRTKNKKLEAHISNIIQGCIQDDRNAQNALFKEYYSYGLSICMRYVSDQLEARSIMNQGFFKIFTSIKSYNSEYDFKPWFKTIMIHTALDYLKKSNRLRAHEAPLEHDDYNHYEDPAVLDSINFNDLLEIVGRLSTSYRAVFNLYVIDGYKHEEIAAKLGITVGASKSNLSRAKLKLRSLIRENLLMI